MASLTDKVAESNHPRSQAYNSQRNYQKLIEERVASLLHLFPVDVVLFPETPLLPPLHIFEPRYKEMIGECIANDSPFGAPQSIPERKL